MMNILESSNLGGSKEVINEVEHQRGLMVDLHNLILPILDPHSGQAKLVRQLFEELFSCSGKIISSLELGEYREKQAILTKYKRKGGENNVENNILEENNKDRGNKRRKNAKHISSVVIQAPYFDGYQWRKYGQKWISKAKHSRSYYRCACSKDQGCPATKTVQQKESGGNGTVRLFDVDYYGQHICNSDSIAHPATHDSSVSIAGQYQSSSSAFVDTDAHGVQDESFGSLFMVPDMPEYLTEFTDVEMAKHVSSVVTQAPYFDGYQWRKYGQKWISKAKHSRSYYRCAYSKEQGCHATKTVQQKESGGNNGTVRLFDVDYYGQHTCNSGGIVHQATHDSSVPVASQNQSSSSAFVDTDAHRVQDQSFESLFMVPDMPEYLTEFTDAEMASKAFEITYMNSPLIPEDIWA